MTPYAALYYMMEGLIIREIAALARKPVSVIARAIGEQVDREFGRAFK